MTVLELIDIDVSRLFHSNAEGRLLLTVAYKVSWEFGYIVSSKSFSII